MPIAHINGVGLFYEITGEGFPVVWCHEFAGDYRSWEPQVRFFSRLYQNITFNNRGYPPSQVPSEADDYTQDALVEDLHGLVRRLEISRAYLVGLSMGGNVVLNFALRYPDFCRGIVVAGCGAGTTNRERFERDVQQVVHTLLHDGMEALASVYARGPTRLPFLRKDPKGWREFRDQFAEHSAQGSALTFQGVQLRRPTIFSLKDRLNQLQVPTLVLVGDEDEPCIEPAVFMKREIPGAGLVVIPQSGHTTNLEEPAAFNAAILSFFQAVEADKWPIRSERSVSLLPEEAR